MIQRGPTSEPDFSDWPKVDLHRHLEGSLRVNSVHELALQGKVPLPNEIEALKSAIRLQPGDERSSEVFLSKFKSIRKVFQSERIVRRMADEAVVDAARDGVRYLELHVTPSALSAATEAPFETMLARALEGASAAAEGRDIKVRIVASVNRHEGAAVAQRVLDAAAARVGAGVVGLDLAGDESRALGREFSNVFSAAREAGLGLSAHAGEWAGPESVQFALEDLAVDRIVHGVRVMENRDIALMARDRRVPFLVCLTSNVDSGVVADVKSHPLPAMIQAGLQVTLNTDDPSLSGITLSDEYRTAVGALEMSPESIKGLILAAAQAAFLTDPERRQLGDRLQRSLGLGMPQ